MGSLPHSYVSFTIQFDLRPSPSCTTCDIFSAFFQLFELWPYLSVRRRSVRRDRKYLCVKVGTHPGIPRLTSLLQLNETYAFIDRVATPNETIELIQITQVCRIWNRYIGMIIERVQVFILSIVNVKIFDGTPLIGNSLLELKWICRVC
jgi:hypothetical protein